LKKAKTILAMPLGMRIQTGIGVSLAVGAALMLSKEEFRTVTNVWAYGSIFALLVLLVSGFGGAFKRALARRFKRNTVVSD
jgi:xanthine/uracil/vitamin C permease (AzgA family)